MGLQAISHKGKKEKKEKKKKLAEQPLPMKIGTFIYLFIYYVSTPPFSYRNQQ